MQKHKRKIIITAILLILLVFIGIYWQILNFRSFKAQAASYSCYGQPSTLNATAPSSVHPGKSFNLTNISGTGNTNIATVHSSTLTFSVSGASPSSFTLTWNPGSVTGDFVSNYPNTSLTANGSVGSAITVNLVSIAAQVTIGSSNTTITCSVNDGTLTANTAGQSLQLAKVNIVNSSSSKPPSSSSTTSGNNTNTTSGSSSTTGSSANNDSTNSAPTATGTSASDQTIQNNRTVEVSVTDAKSAPVNKAKVTMDSKLTKETDANGRTTFAAVAIGKHNLSVHANGRTVTKQIDVKSDPAGNVLNISIQMPAVSIQKSILMISIASGTILFLGSGTLAMIKLKHKIPINNVLQPTPNNMNLPQNPVIAQTNPTPANINSSSNLTTTSPSPVLTEESAIDTLPPQPVKEAPQIKLHPPNQSIR